MAAKAEVLSPGEYDEDEIVMSTGGLSAIEEADRSNMVRTAKQYPRELTKFVKNLTAISCLSPEVAQQMIYSVPRAGKQLIGPSIRFAEAALSCWGNSRAGYEVVDVDRQGEACFVVVEGRFYDCETNVGWAPRIKRRVVAKVINADAIQVTGAAGSSIAVRSAILRGVPEAIWRPIWDKARQTAVGDAKSMTQLIEMSWKFFQALGITEHQILNALGVPGKADIGPDEILAMTAWQRQLREKESTVEDIFGSPEDFEIEQWMDALKWPSTKRNMARETFKGNRKGLLEQVRKVAQEAGITIELREAPQKMSAQQVEAVQNGEGKKEEPSQTTSTTQQGHHSQERAPSTTQSESEPSGQTDQRAAPTHSTVKEDASESSTRESGSSQATESAAAATTASKPVAGRGKIRW